MKKMSLLSSSVLVILLAPLAHAKPLLADAIRAPVPLRPTLAPVPRKPLNEITPAATPSNPTLPSILTTTFSDDEVNACITSTCGPAAGNGNAFGSVFARVPETAGFQTLWQTRVLPEITAALALDQQKTARSLDRLDQLLASGAKAPVGSPAQAYLTLASLISRYIANQFSSALTIDYATGSYALNDFVVAQLISAIPTSAEQNAVRLIIDRVYRPAVKMISQEATLPGQNPLVGRLRKLYPKSASLAEALKLDGAALVAKLDRFRARLGAVLAAETLSQMESDLFRRAAAGSDLSVAESGFYVAAAQKFESLAPVADADLFAALMAVPVDLDGALKQVKAQGLIGQARAKLNALTVAQRLDQVAPTCRQNLGLALSMKASALAYRNLDSVLREIKGAAKIVAGRLVPEPARPYVADMIEQVRFETVPETKQIVDALELTVVKEVATSRDFLGQLGASSKDIDDMLLVLGPMLVTGSVASEAVSQACGAIQIASVSDATLTAQGRISLSWFTANYSEVGMGIAAHELGHMVSATMRAVGGFGQRAPGFLASLNCVTNRNPFVVEPVNFEYAQNSPWSEEDWADHFSAMTLNEMSKSATSWARFSKNMGCALVTQMPDYIGNTIAPTKGDTHSSGFFRLLMIGQDRGQLAPACQKFVTYGATNARPLTCN